MMRLLDSLLGRGDDEADSDQTPTSDLSVSELCDALSNPRRRRVLRVIADLDGDDGVDLGDLAEVVAAQEYDTTVDALTGQERKRVYVSLYQTHVPKLADMGLVATDTRDSVYATRETTVAITALDAIGDVVGGDA